ncbi:hypothetical protein FACS1894200_10650 [Spirochaetia bacterium]|nr:hypothetical protein FACS1894200_10650 [Spirochaetia bacterium]
MPDSYSDGRNLFIDYMANSRKAGTYQIDARDRTEKRDGDFGYIETKYGAYCTSYYGSSGNRLMIPETLNGLTVTAIGFVASGSNIKGAFEGKNVSRVFIPNSVTSIGENAFTQNQLTSVTIPDSVTYIGDDAFRDNKLTSVTIPNGITYIGERAFRVNNLTSVTIPNSVTSIGEGAFRNNNLTSVTIPNSVTSIGKDAFLDDRRVQIRYSD